MDPSTQAVGDGVYADPAQAESAFHEAQIIVKRITDKLSELEDQHSALKAIYAGNHSDNLTHAATNFSTNMSDVTAAGNAVVEAARQALQLIVKHDVA
jgi:hypothetical protein